MNARPPSPSSKPKSTSPSKVRATSASKPRATPASKPAKSKPRGSLLVLGQRLLRDDKRAVLKLARRVFRAGNAGVVDVGLTFVHDLEMRALNRAWRKVDTTTDVLSFPAHVEDGVPVRGDEDVLGDLVISVDTARRQARALGHGVDVEIAVLVAHGITHLAGLDHERSDEEAAAQVACERTLLAQARVDVRAALTGRGS